MEWPVALAQEGDLIHYVSKEARRRCRRDVVNNAELLGRPYHVLSDDPQQTSTTRPGPVAVR